MGAGNPQLENGDFFLLRTVAGRHSAVPTDRRAEGGVGGRGGRAPAPLAVGRPHKRAVRCEPGPCPPSLPAATAGIMKFEISDEQVPVGTIGQGCRAAARPARPAAAAAATASRPPYRPTPPAGAAGQRPGLCRLQHLCHGGAWERGQLREGSWLCAGPACARTRCARKQAGPCCPPPPLQAPQQYQDTFLAKASELASRT